MKGWSSGPVARAQCPWSLLLSRLNAFHRKYMPSSHQNRFISRILIQLQTPCEQSSLLNWYLKQLPNFFCLYRNPFVLDFHVSEERKRVHHSKSLFSSLLKLVLILRVFSWQVSKETVATRRQVKKNNHVTRVFTPGRIVMRLTGRNEK